MALFNKPSDNEKPGNANEPASSEKKKGNFLTRPIGKKAADSSGEKKGNFPTQPAGKKAADVSVKKKGNFLTQPVGKKALPGKTYINLVQIENNREKNLAAIAGFIIFLVLLFFFTKFCVIDLLKQADDAESRYNQMSTQLAELTIENAV